MRCWLDHLLRKVRIPHIVHEMFQAVRRIMLFREAMPTADPREVINGMLEDFYETYAAQEEFIKYFKDFWHRKSGMALICMALSRVVVNCCA